jgi:DNA/RNA endonuclease G (NUC1)
MDNVDDKLRRWVESIQRNDGTLREELSTVVDARTPADLITLESATNLPAEPQFVPETIVLRVGRPVLTVSNDQPTLTFEDVESEVWKERLQRAREPLGRAIQAVGRIEVQGHPRFSWIGTGWLVAPDVVVTNRHVAREFGSRSGEAFVFRQGLAGSMKASIDFLEEFQRRDERPFPIAEIMYISPDEGPDVAFLRVKTRQGLAAHIDLSQAAAKAGDMVALIGYPAKDSRIPEPDLMQRVFGDIYDKKRLAPGQILGLQSSLVLHDCSSLGGNSGSVVLSLSTGNAVALHFAGRFLEANYAVPSATLADLLDKAQRGESLASSSAALPRRSSDQEFEVTIPITVRVGAPQYPGSAPAPRARAPVSRPAARPLDAGAPDLFEPESRPEDYQNRPGYSEAFLGKEKKFKVPLPIVTRNTDDVLSFKEGNKTADVLRYQHFSVKMSRSRRMCLFSAVNIDGKQSRKVRRTGWRRDSRIPADAQIKDECYGNPPRFARGHMSRREDPVWGTMALASLGNDDSMHVTNTVPQMQPFNAGIWLSLEDYALDHAREDDMRLCVITGPILEKDDPIRYDIAIPVVFWKVIAFIHDDTGKLSATGYTLSQEDYLQEEEFVFGQHKTSQVSIAWIQSKTGLSFGHLADVDPLARGEEGPEAGPLTDPSQIRFIS